MCSIIASFDLEQLKELVHQNRVRGEYSHSITYFDSDFNNGIRLLHCERALGPLDLDKINPPNHINNIYTIVHQQAPTGVDSENCIHPAAYDGNLLWHVGLLKPKTIDDFIHKYKDYFAWTPSNKVEWISWDTYLLLLRLHSYQKPYEVDGSFACLWYKYQKLYAFRNEIVPLWMDNNFTFSSTKFKNSYQITPNQVLELDLHKKTFKSVASFTTVDNPYYYESAS